VHHIYTDEEMFRRLMRPAGIASLGALRHLEQLLDARRKELILEARRRGWGWDEMGRAFGVSAQAVQQQWKRYVSADEDPDD
jgi:hypothetical protein